MIALRSILHNLAVVAVGFVVALVGVTLDRLFAIGEFRSIFTAVFGSLVICIGFLIRLWATYLFYKNNMKVIVHGAAENATDIGPFPLFT
jgi:sulfite exporter TauE/SafE